MLCPELGARPTALSALPAALPAVPVQTGGAKKHLLGAELCRAVLGCDTARAAGSAGCGALGHGGERAGGCPCRGTGAWGLPCFVNTQLLLRARTKPNLWRLSINYNVLGTVISTSGPLNFVLIRVSLFLSQHFFPSAGYRSFLCGDLTNC